MKVLIIDDEEDYRSVANMSLNMIGGMEVIEAASGAEGLEKAVADSPDVILLDLLMPEMDGTQTFTALRNNPATMAIPVIFVTTKGMFPEFNELKAQGALAVLTKPFDPLTFGSQINGILNQNGNK